MSEPRETRPGDATPPEPASHGGSPLRLRSRIMAGLVLVIPIWFTFVVVSFVFRLMRNASLWLVEAWLYSPFGESLVSHWGLTSEQLAAGGLESLPLPVQWSIGLVAVVLTITALYVLGAVATNVVGRRIIRLVESLVERVPLVTVVYHACKKVLETLTDEGTRPFQQVVLVPFPSQETQSVGFVTRCTRDHRTGEKLYTVFLATTPNPTTGFMFVVRASEAVELNWTVEEAVKVIMSGGVLMPEAIPFPPRSSR